MRFLVAAWMLPLGLLAGCSSRERPKLDIRLADGVVLQMVRIEAGRFHMGSSPAEQVKAQDAATEAKKDWALQERPHDVEISKPFYIGIYEVTQGQYQAVMDRNPSYYSTSGAGKDGVQGLNTSWFPVDSVSWDDALEFCRRLSDKEDKVFDLPTEAEWEYACRAGTTSAFAFGSTLSARQANFYGAAVEQGTTSVGSFEPNAFGLYDMHGNVAEWCKDWYDREYYNKSPRVDPPGPSTGSFRVIRGGCCFNPLPFCRSAARNYDRPNQHGDRKAGDVYGFRVVMR